jgi:Ran GTPase-activating protein (RanGAP) involved in mRNA processing and transport
MNFTKMRKRKLRNFTFGKSLDGPAPAPSWIVLEPSSKYHFLTVFSYPHCKSIRFWKTYCEDEGVRAICQFLELGKGTVTLELLDNKITPLGCEFIARAMQPKMNPTLLVLKLDHNEFGSAGVIELSKSLAVNPVLKLISLTYCGIDHTSAQALFEMLIYTKSALEDVNLSGNVLGNEGC